MSLLKEFLKYLGESGYGVRKYNYLQEYEILSDTLSVGTFVEDGDNLVFFYDDTCYMPLRDFILDDLEVHLWLYVVNVYLGGIFLLSPLVHNHICVIF